MVEVMEVAEDTEISTAVLIRSVHRNRSTDALLSRLSDKEGLLLTLTVVILLCTYTPPAHSWGQTKIVQWRRTFLQDGMGLHMMIIALGRHIIGLLGTRN
jgi:hypothetical protein